MKPIIAIPAIGALVYRAYSKKSLTTPGIFVATCTAIAHAFHPWNMPFALLCVFFLAGTRVTHVKEDVKKTLTIPSKGTSGGEGPRTHVQVLANSLVASILCVVHAFQLDLRQFHLEKNVPNTSDSAYCFSWGGDILIVGIIANYAAVAADTFSSELGILSKSSPRLITSLNLRKVPPGTNGGVTLVGLAAGLFGSILMVTTAILFMPMCSDQTASMPGGGSPWSATNKRTFMLAMVAWGFLGSVFDSVLGGLFQNSVKDVRSGKIVEGEGGNRVLVSPTPGPLGAPQAGQSGMPSYAQAVASGTDAKAGTPSSGGAKSQKASSKGPKPSFGDEQPSRVVESGSDWFDNNDVNFVMALTMSVGAMLIAAKCWGIPFENMLKP